MAKNAINTFSQPTDPSATVVCKDLLESPDIEHNDSLRDIQSIRAGEPIVIKADAYGKPPLLGNAQETVPNRHEEPLHCSQCLRKG